MGAFTHAVREGPRAGWTSAAILALLAIAAATPDADPATRAAIVAAADGDFVQGIRVALGVAIALLALVLAAAYAGFPHGPPGG